MAVVKDRHINRLRGSRFRKARRYLKRNPDAYVEVAFHDMVIFGPPTFGNGAYDMPDHTAMEVTNRENNVVLCGAFAEPELGEPITDPGTPVFEPIVVPNETPVVPKISIEAEPYACHVCGAIEPNPCVTKGGNKAKQRHAGRDTL